MTNNWRPMYQSEDDASALHEGIQPWFARGIWQWIEGCLSFIDQAGRRIRLDTYIDDFDQKRRSAYPATADFERFGIDGLQHKWDDDLDVMPFIDYLLWRNGPSASTSTAEKLEILLLNGGSAWKVGSRDGHRGLERRVPIGVQEAAEHTMATSGDAGRRLSAAWHAAFGHSPDPSKAYSLAVKAVEDAVKPAVAPNDGVATLGKMNGAVRDQAGWGLPLAREDAKSPTKDILLGMMRALWAGQADRHGGDPDPKLVITQQAAETAVLLAVPLVQWFTSGVAARRPQLD